jgi:2-amino-4-hydroxy-6-hydroxymethyldihydropteridine diphosphokinase
VPQCWIGLGGNQGDVPSVFEAMAHRLVAFAESAPAQFSPIFRTAPMGADAGQPYFNAVAGFHTNLSPHALLDQLQAWEAEFGRVRTVRWGPRTLDLDLLFYGDVVLSDDRLTLPHPGAWFRRFVLDPLATIAPDWMHPVWRVTTQQLRERLTVQPASITLWCEAPTLAESLRTELSARLSDVAVIVADGTHAAADGLMVALGTAIPAAWRTAPHLQMDAHRPHSDLVQSLVDAATAAFAAPQPFLPPPERGT